MQLTNLESRRPHVFSAPCASRVTSQAAGHCRARPRRLDDYFQRDWLDLDDAQRRILVGGNKEIIGNLMQKKCEAGEWQDEQQPGGLVKKVLISPTDLFGVVPRLSDARFKVLRKA
jgi:hypothetical protein